MSKRHYVALDGLRGEVALIVAATHTNFISGFQAFQHGYLAVDFFFILSGFVIANAYESRLRDTMTFSEFVIVRAIRLYPMIVIGALVGAITVAITTTVPLATLITTTAAAVLVLPCPSQLFGAPHDSLWPIDPPAWSLFWEIVINLIFGVILYKARIKTLYIVILAGFVMLLAVAYNFNTLETGFIVDNWWGGLARVIFGFTLGIVLNRLNLTGRLPKIRANILVISGVLLVIFAIRFNQYKGIYDILVVTIVFPVIIIAGLNVQTKNILWIWSGRLSYPLYLVHAPILYLIKPMTEGMSPHMRLGYSLIAVLISVCAAFMIDVFCDQPLRAGLTKSLTQKRLNPVQVA